MIKIKYNTRVFIDKRTNRIKIRIRWNNQETTLSMSCRADAAKWDETKQRPSSGTMHVFRDQNMSARALTAEIDQALDEINEAFTRCELDSVMPTKEALKVMIRGEQPQKEPVKLKKTFDELFEEFMNVVGDEHNWTEKVHYKYVQAWNQLHSCFPRITIETLTKDKMRELRNWYIENHYRNVTIKKQFSFLRTFLKWLQSEGYEIRPGVVDYKPNLTIVPKTVTFLKYDELMKFYDHKFAGGHSNWETARDLFCFMAFTSLRYSDLAGLKRANVHDDHLEIVTQKTHDKLSIPLISYAKDIIHKYEGVDYKKGVMFPVPSNQKLNSNLKEAAKEAGLEREVSLLYYKGSKRHEEVRKFYEIIGCHDGRRTFVCCSLAFGIPPTVVMSVTGHSTYKAMQPYIEVCDETQQKELAKWEQKGNSLKDDVAKKLANADEEMLKKVIALLDSGQ